MNTYIALLRGINVSGQKKIKMAELKTILEDIGLTSVTTYIQSGNIVFTYQETKLTILGGLISEAILKHYDFEVPVLVLTPKTLADIYKDNPFAKRIENEEIEGKKMYFTLLSSPPNSLNLEELTSQSHDSEEFVVTNKVVYFYAGNGYGKTKLNNNFFEKKLNSKATTRNLKTIYKILEISNLT